ncbi:NADPH-dependent FMN reductase [Granulicoccus phenolivorans]|uniref:NADPH-dependent FMN reductase n=1 Tax=Granulicoccus phenolivorans TaxID=266854 RepID=UPI0004260F6D|nr:NAD(P)H-dependent oxidoreductase [Granulicoccus phenolivorans]
MNNLSIIVSSTRPQRVGGHVTAWVRETLGADWDITVLDLAEINLPFIDEDMPAGSGIYTQPHTLAWKEKIDAADAIVVVNPEYNGFFPAPLKNAIDYLLAEWENKPMAVVGYGFGGGARSAAALTELLQNVKANVVGSLGLFFNTDLSPTGELTVTPGKTEELRALSLQLDAALGDELAA